MTSPEKAVKMDTGKAEEANLSAQDRLELARRNVLSAAPQGTADLEDAYRQSQGELERLKNEQRLAQERLKALPKAPPAMEMPTAPASVDDPSRTKAGASGAVNYVRAMSDEVPDVLAEQALNMRKDNPRGGQAIIDANALAIQKQADLGLGDYGLTRTEGGVQLALPPTTVAERQADIDRQNKESQAELAQKTEQARIQQEAQAQKLEQQRLAYEADLERLRQERAQAGQQLNEVTGQKRTVAPLQRALTKAENDAEIAKRKLARAKEQPNAVGRTLQNVGTGSAKIGALPRAGVGAGAGYLGVMSYQEALERYKAGDTSEAVLKALEAGAATAAVVPPAGKKLSKVRGTGVLGGLGLGTYELGRRLLKDAPPEE
jgi:fused signal recognition particle receptor